MQLELSCGNWRSFCLSLNVWTHWSRVMPICVSNLSIIGSDNGLSPGWRQAIFWTNAGILLIRTLGTNASEILSEIHTFSFTKMHLKVSSAKWRLFRLGLNVLRELVWVLSVYFSFVSTSGAVIHEEYVTKHWLWYTLRNTREHWLPYTLITRNIDSYTHLSTRENIGYQTYYHRFNFTSGLINLPQHVDCNSSVLYISLPYWHSEILTWLFFLTKQAICFSSSLLINSKNIAHTSNWSLCKKFEREISYIHTQSTYNWKDNVFHHRLDQTNKMCWLCRLFHCENVSL